MSINYATRAQPDEFEYHDLEGRVQALVAKDLMKQCGPHNKLSLKDVRISKSAMITIGQAINQMALELEVPTTTLNKQMSKSMYDLKGDLVFIFNVGPQGSYADCVVCIPFGYWQYQNEGEGVQ